MRDWEGPKRCVDPCSRLLGLVAAMHIPPIGRHSSWWERERDSISRQVPSLLDLHGSAAPPSSSDTGAISAGGVGDAPQTCLGQ